MKSLSIFIASSFELSADRIAIGDIILRASEKILQSHNIYVRMCCWEDYDPTYIGIPTQRGYDENLIKKSQVVIALFKTKCGMYTQKEIDFGKSLGIPIEYLQRQTEESLTDDLKNYLKDNACSPYLYKDMLELEGLILKIISRYRYTKSIDIADIPPPACKLGAIVRCGVPYDFDKVESFVSHQSFNNIIRQLNEIILGYGCGRIRLLDTYDEKMCDTLVACFQDKVDAESESILDEAGKHIKTKDSKLSRLNIFFYHDGNDYLPSVKAYNHKLMNYDSWEYFPVHYKHQDTVKMYLFRLLVCNIFQCLSNFSLSGFVLQYNNLPVADIRNLPFLENGLKEVERFCTQIDAVKTKPKDNDSIFKLLNLQERLQTKVLLTLNYWVNESKLELKQLNEENELLDEFYSEKKYDEIINTTKLENVQTLIKKFEEAQETVENRKETLVQKIKTIEYRIKALQEKEYNIENTESIVKCYDSIVDILYKLTKQSSEYKRMLLYQCNALCLFADNGIVISDYDRYYEYQIEILESDAELMQEVTFDVYLVLEANLLNGYNNNQKWSVGDKLVEKIKNQIETFHDKIVSEKLLESIVHVMDCIVGYYGNKGYIKQALLCQRKAEYYQDIMINRNRKRYLHSMLATIVNRMLNHNKQNKWQAILKDIWEGDQLINEVESNSYDVCNMWYADKTVYYRTVASMYYEVEIIRNLVKSEHNFELGYEAVEHIKDTNHGIYLEKKSDLHHNHAFMLTHFYNFKVDTKVAEKIIEEYEFALSLRETLTIYNSAYGIILAQTMVNIGNIYRELQRYDDAVRYALKARSIYEQFLDENVIATVEHVYQARLLYVTTLRDKAFNIRDISEFNFMVNEIKTIMTWASKHKDEIEYFGTIEEELFVSKNMETKITL